MCGICGKLYYDQQRPVEQEVLVAMCNQIVHRGPDSDGFYVNGPVGLGSRRLSIIDVEGGRMPISNEDGSIWIVYNGEIYNFPQLRERLERSGHHFSTRTDTEAIVHLYEEEGDDFVRHLNGMFAIAIWDERRRRLVLVRDHLGIKPLYYAKLSDRVVFGSEIKAMLADSIQREIDPMALHDYLSLNYVPGPRTIFANIRKLLPGHMLIYEAAAKTIKIQQYWDLPPTSSCQLQAGVMTNLEDELLALLRAAVQDQMISDVPLGAFLSGGIDSSLVVALMSEVSDRPVQTFSVGFQEESYSELPYARIVAERFETAHHELILKPRARDIVTAMTEYFDEPFADSSSLAVYAVSKLAANDVKVVLSGDGGDEVFGGYATYQADKIAAYYRRLPKFISAGLLPRLANMIPPSDGKVSFDFKLKRFMAGGALPALAAHYAWKAYFSEEMKLRLYKYESDYESNMQFRPSVDVLRAYYDNYPGDDVLNGLLYVDAKVQLVDDMLTKVDRMSMAHSLEVRVPLLDLRLVEFMARLPSEYKVRGMTLKYLLKRVCERVLPHEILHRPKAGFSVPMTAWIKSDLKDMVNDYLSPRAVEKQDIFEPQVIRQLLEAHWSGQQNYSHNIWNLLMFTLWYERYIDSTVANVNGVYEVRAV